MKFLLLTSFAEVMGYVGYIAIAILVLLVMITIHELGHYIAGKIFGFGIEEFAIGFGPKLFKKKIKKTGERTIRAKKERIKSKKRFQNLRYIQSP